MKENIKLLVTSIFFIIMLPSSLIAKDRLPTPVLYSPSDKEIFERTRRGVK